MSAAMRARSTSASSAKAASSRLASSPSGIRNGSARLSSGGMSPP